MASIEAVIYDARGIEVRRIGEPRDLQWSTKMPGGLGTLSFSYTGDLVDRWDEYENPSAVRCEVTDSGGTLLYSGYRSPRSWGLQGSTIAFEGYWQTLFDVPFGIANGVYTSPTYPQTVIEDILRYGTSELETTTAYLLRNDADIAATDNEFEIGRRYAGDVLVELLKFPDRDGNQWWAYVLADRILRYEPRKTEPEWYVSVDDLEPTFQFTLDDSDMRSSVLIDYSDMSGTAATFTGHNADTQRRLLGKDRVGFVTLDSQALYGPDAVSQVASLYLAEHATPRQRTSGMTIVSQTVQDSGGREYPAYHVRAGDVLRVVDLPLSSQTWDETLDSLRVFNLVQTTVRVDGSGRTNVEVVPDYAGKSLDILFARLAQSVKQQTT